MEKYTWDDIIINPNSEQAQACIGKEVYFADNPTICLDFANNTNKFCGILQRIKVGDCFPFVSKSSDTWVCIIPKKKEGK